VYVELEPTVKRALELNAFMEGVAYPRYDRKRTSRDEPTR
jgi:hypothetical protein